MGPPAQHATVHVVVTAPYDPTPPEDAEAAAAAARHRLPFVERRGRPLDRVAREAGADAVLVLGRRRVSLWVEGMEHPWHAGMGELRLKRLARGEATSRDTFLEAAALRPGDHVLDATLGLGMDALVAAGVVGPSGRVVGIEASPALAALAAEGLARHPSDAARRISVVCADAADALVRMPPRSFDVIVFDPMFRHTRAAAGAFDLVRRLGSATTVAPATMARARTVARRHVVVKDGAPGWDLSRLGLTPLPSVRGARLYYARVPAL